MWKVVLATVGLTLITLNLLYRERHTDSFELWKQEHGFSFPTAQDTYRKIIFLANKQEINEFNGRDHETYQKGVNQFTHLTDDQFIRTYMKPMEKEQTKDFESYKYVGADIDWVIAGKVSTVKNQGACDAGYAFSTTSLIESFNLITKNNGTLLSEQQLVDCSGTYGTKGCQGGSRSGALTYVKQKGIAFESQYPYKGIAQTCKIDGGVTKFTNFLNTTGCDGLATALKVSPVSVAVDATNWKSYRSGIFNNCTTTVTQDALLVGVSATAWKVKNSWGLSWGEYGYIRLAPGNTCGICGITGFWVI